MNGGEFLQGLDVPEFRHRTLSSSKRLVRVVGSLVEPTSAPLTLRDSHHLHRGTVGAKRAKAKRESEDDIIEREVAVPLADFATVWTELFPAEQARIVQLLLERVGVQEDALEVRIRVEGLGSLVGELRRQGERKAA